MAPIMRRMDSRGAARSAILQAAGGLALAAGLAGCGDPTERLLLAYDRLLTCQSQPDPVPAGLRQLLRAQLSESLRRAAALPGSGMTAGQQGACAAALEQLPCDQIADLGVLTSVRACNPAGHLADGEVCSENGQCRSGQCSAVRVGRCGACVPLQAAGQPCGGQRPACAAGLSCINGACAPRGEVGAACGQANQALCQPWLSCVNRVCTQPTVARRGEACGAVGVICAAGAACRGGQCTPVVAAGGACNGAVPCSAFHACNFATRRCEPAPTASLGGLCGVMNNNAPCVEGYCAASFRCEPLVADGASCMTSAMCQRSSVCADQRCQPLPTCPAP